MVSGLSRELLIRYGSRDDVRSSLIDNFFSVPIIGPESDHYQKQKRQISEFRSRENESIVRRWADEYIRHLDAQTEAARMLEEREFV